jgi:hypothetical protein
VTKETPRDVLEDLHRFIDETKAATGAALRGLREVRFSLEQSGLVPNNPDPLVHFGEGPPTSPEGTAYAVWRRSEALANLVPRGPVDARLTQQWLVALFTAWEHEYRPRLAVAHGLGKDTLLLYNPWGDLRHLRNDIVHHHGIATRNNAGRCRELIWFSDGEKILLRATHFVALDKAYRWEEMERPPAPQNIGIRQPCNSPTKKVKRPA